MRRQFGPEALECRHLLSFVLPGITATSPADGTTQLQGPQSLTITFDQSVVEQIDDEFSGLFGIAADQVLPTIVADDSNQDVEIDQIGTDGTATPYLGGAQRLARAGDGQYDRRPGRDDPDPTGHLAAGRESGDDAGDLSARRAAAEPPGAAFAAIETTSAWATATDPIPIAQFTVLGQGPTLARATDLGLIGPNAQSVWGFIDPGNYHSAVALYQFSVPDGQTWQFDAKLLAHAIGSPLLPTVTLFDSNGDVLASRSASGGSGANSTDPELVQGLAPGTYFLGISAAGNVPGQAGGYDPESGKPGTAGVNEPAGLFGLELSATPAPAPTRLVGFNLDHADTLEPSPTGLDLTFSGPVDADSLTAARPAGDGPDGGRFLRQDVADLRRELRVLRSTSSASSSTRPCRPGTIRWWRRRRAA